MVFAWVRLYASLDVNAQPSTQIYALLLPDAGTGDWAELEVRSSPLDGSGVFSRQMAGGFDWSNVRKRPALLVRCFSRPFVPACC